MSDAEQKIIEILRELKPFERIEIVKDQNGRPDYYIVHRSQKIVVQPIVEKKTNMV